MARIQTKTLLDRIAKADFNALRLRGLQNGAFCLLLECDDGAFIHENLDGSIKEYPQINHALDWLKRKTEVTEIIVDIEIWKRD